jgi:tetratricopeptide (TPR) repeat protein
VDPGVGLRVRELRIAREMTQADLAAKDFTKGFISLLETGRTRVSLRAAEILAQRLGVSSADLIAGGDGEADLELALLRAEQQLSAGRAVEAIEVLERLANKATGSLRARALRARGRALVEAARPREGLVLLEEAGRAFESMGQRESVIRTIYDRALAYAHLNEPGNALALALECDAAMTAGGLVDRTLELQVRSLLATTFARSGDLESADWQAQRALRLAEDVVDPDALGSLYSTLSFARQRQNDLSGAMAYARKGLAVFEELGRERAVGQMWHNVATIYIDRRQYDKAAEAIERSERIAKRAKLPTLEARLLTTRGELAAARGRWEEAARYARSGSEHPGASSYTRSRGFLLQAQALAARRGPLSRIRPMLHEAASSVRDEPARIRAEVHEAFATILAARGQWREAYKEARTSLNLLRPDLSATEK